MQQKQIPSALLNFLKMFVYPQLNKPYFALT